MNINADYSQRVVVNHHDLPWISSPELGVERRMLERLGDEVAKATSREMTSRSRREALERNVGLRNYKKRSWAHDFFSCNFVDVSLGQNFECFVNAKGMKKNTKVMTDSLTLH